MDPLVGIVLVSHSSEIARGLKSLLGQIGSGAVTVIAAGGTDEGGIGTSYQQIRGALRAADTGAGVVVLPDLGSSVLTTRAVLDDDPAIDAVTVDAPFLEGAVAAVVAAEGGADVSAVAEAAEEARHVSKF
ncbi:dihydroxyacetone kinase phosphoryl donor subunit DhaM [Streptomyces sp. NPDC035033]|uniref:dihydroxyacetone kinase phosphoryl donor subunit DhaM n=1 Tax=Streptomyces sp. NPDC035033 TaxID=3155368 RepID=UPI0033E98B64